MKRFTIATLLSLLCLGACAPAAEQTVATPKAPDEDAILATVDAFFLAMAERDADAIAAISAPGANSVGLGYRASGAAPPYRTTMQEFIDDLREGNFPERAHEAYWSPTVLQRADLAVVWTPYRIDIAGKRIHCGIDVFSMSRENGKWLIDSLSFTMEPASCPELEPANVVARPVFAD